MVSRQNYGLYQFQGPTILREKKMGEMMQADLAKIELKLSL